MNLRTGGEGVKKSENFADVIYGSPLGRRLNCFMGLCLYVGIFYSCDLTDFIG